MIAASEQFDPVLIDRHPDQYRVHQQMDGPHRSVEHGRKNGIGPVFYRTPVITFNVPSQGNLVFQIRSDIGYGTQQHQEAKDKMQVIPVGKPRIVPQNASYVKKRERTYQVKQGGESGNKPDDYLQIMTEYENILDENEQRRKEQKPGQIDVCAPIPFIVKKQQRGHEHAC